MVLAQGGHVVVELLGQVGGACCSACALEVSGRRAVGLASAALGDLAADFDVAEFLPDYTQELLAAISG